MNKLPEGYAPIAMPPIQHHFSGGVYAKQAVLDKAGTFVLTHKHKFDHMSVLATGRVKVTVEGVATEHTAPTVIEIKAEQEHEILTLSDNVTWFCIHAIPEGYEESGEYIDDVLISHED